MASTRLGLSALEAREVCTTLIQVTVIDQLVSTVYQKPAVMDVRLAAPVTASPPLRMTKSWKPPR